MIRSGGFKRVNKKERSIGRLYIQTKKKKKKEYTIEKRSIVHIRKKKNIHLLLGARKVQAIGYKEACIYASLG